MNAFRCTFRLAAAQTLLAVLGATQTLAAAPPPPARAAAPAADPLMQKVRLAPPVYDVDVPGGAGPRGEPEMICTQSTGDPVGNCHPFEFPRVAGTSVLSCGAGRQRAADQFRTAATGTFSATQVCWWGSYGTACGAEPADSFDKFVISYYTLDGATGLPIEPAFASFRQDLSQLAVVKRHICSGNSSTEHTGTHAAVTLAANTCYWIEIRNEMDGTQNWFWSRSINLGSNYDGTNLLDADGVYDLTDTTLSNGDRAFCVNVSQDTSPLGVASGCVIVAPVPVCNEPPSNCQVYTDLPSSRNSSTFANGFTLAENFSTTGPASVTGGCFYGLYTAQAAAPSDEQFIITYYNDAGSFPGSVIATYTCGGIGPSPGTDLNRDGADSIYLNFYQWGYSHPAVNLPGAGCYWVEVVSNSATVAWQRLLKQPNVAPGDGYYCWKTNTRANYLASDQLVGNDAPMCLNIALQTNSTCPSPGTPPPPANDLCANATVITGTGSFAFNNFYAETDGPPSCDNQVRDVWYSWTAPCDGTYSFDTCQSDGDTLISVYPGTACDPLPGYIACADDSVECAAGAGVPSYTTFPALAGEQFLLRIGMWSDSPDNLQPGTAGSLRLLRLEGDCPSAGGACCCGSSCTNVANSGLCVSPGGGIPVTFVSGGNCSPFSVTTPCCRANFNASTIPPVISSQDIFDFLAAFFSTNINIKACADFNGNPPSAANVTSQDIFDFLAAFFRPGGCIP